MSLADESVGLLDADTLFAMPLCDTLLSLAEAGLFLPRWSAEILEEVRGNLVESGRCTPAQALRRIRLMNEAFPEALVEDAGIDDGTGALVRAAAPRLSWDAPIHSWADVEALPLPARHLNIKPSRFGTVRALLDCIERARGAGIELYGGGQFELGVGRGQIQALASLFYPDGPNDVAPIGYNEPQARAGLPASPLAPAAQVAGFGFDGT